MELVKTLDGKEIPEWVRGILYICKYDHKGPSIEVLGSIFYPTASSALEAYANIPNPESQMVSARTYEDLISNLKMKHLAFKDPEWLRMLGETL